MSQPVPLEDVGLTPALVAEIDAAPHLGRVVGRTVRAVETPELGRRRPRRRFKTKVHELDRRVVETEGVGPLVRGVEVDQDALDGGPREVDRHRDPMLLSEIAEVDPALEGQRIAGLSQV